MLKTVGYLRTPKSRTSSILSAHGAPAPNKTREEITHSRQNQRVLPESGLILIYLLFCLCGLRMSKLERTRAGGPAPAVRVVAVFVTTVCAGFRIFQEIMPTSSWGKEVLRRPVALIRWYFSPDTCFLTTNLFVAPVALADLHLFLTNC